MSTATQRSYFDTEVGTSVSARKPDLAFPNFARQYSDPERKWQIEVQKQLLNCTRFDTAGWDSYDAPPVRMDTAFFALVILSSVMKSRTPIPQVVPSSVGGIQLEWHEKNIDLEIHVAAPYKCELWFQDRASPLQPPISLDLSSDYSALVGPIQSLTTR